MKIKSLFTKVLDALTGIIFTALIAVVTLQILGRTPLLQRPFHWTEEVTRMLFIFLIAAGSITGVLHNEYVAVDIIPTMLKEKSAIIYNAVIHFIVGGFLLYLVPAGMKFTKLGARQLSPGLRFNMKYIYGLILISIVGMELAQMYMGIKSINQLRLSKISKEDPNG